MPMVTAQRWRGRSWGAESLAVVAGQAEARVRAWGVAVRKRLLHAIVAHGAIDGGRRFDLDAHSRLDWTAAGDLAALETEPGELAHLAEGGAHLSVLRLARLPDECVWLHALDAPGARFVYQPPLTPEEIAEGCIRPPAVVGSYAVFAADDGRKVAHIPRPVAVDARGERVWGTIEIAGGVSTVRFDRAALRERLHWGLEGITIYGLDTFGYTSIGGSGDYLTQGIRYILADSQPSSGGDAESITFRTKSWSLSEGSVACALYSESASKPSGKLAEDTTGINYTHGTWDTCEFDSSYAVAASTQYWLAIWNHVDEGATICLSYDSGTGDSYKESTSPEAFNWPSTASPTGEGAGKVYSIYCTYTPSGGGALPMAMNHYRRRRS